MRIRSIKPEFWRSDDISSLRIPDRLLFVGLWSYVDDSGIGVDKLSHICADLFAADLEEDPEEVFGRVRGGLRELSRRGLIIRYEANGGSYLYVTKWASHQRIDKPSKTRYPLPDLREYADPDEFREGSSTTPEKVALGTEEQGNRGTGEKETTTRSSKPDFSDDFIEFYLAYPRKGSRGTAATAYTKARTKAGHEAILEGARRYAADPNRDPAFTKLPASWLNQECWDDDPLPARGAPPTRAERNLSRGLELIRSYEQPTQLAIGATHE